MAQVGERVMAVITTRSTEVFNAGNVRAANAGVDKTVAAGTVADARAIAQTLALEGFELLYFHPVAISFSGTPDNFERVFGVRPVRRVFAGGRGRQVEGFDIDPSDARRLASLPAVFAGRAGTVAVARPPKLIDDAVAPVRDVSAADLSTWSLPDELAISIWADGSSAAVATGHGVVVAQVGTGHFRHRFFSDRGYRVLPTLLGPGQQGPQRDDHGHSTGEAACLFGAAPDLRLRPVKGLIDPVGDLLMTVDSTPKPDLIMNSWGYDVDGMDWEEIEAADPNLCSYLRILEAAIDFATASGVVLCAAAPRSWKSFPACHPDVIAIAAASDSTMPSQPVRHGGASRLYPGRMVPDLWSDAARSVRAGLDLVGCTHPVQPGSVLCRPGLRDSGGDDGFAWCDIEQAASPLAASRLVLLLEKHRGLTPAAFKAMVTDAAGSPLADGLVQAGSTPPPEEGVPKLAG